MELNGDVPVKKSKSLALKSVVEKFVIKLSDPQKYGNQKKLLMVTLMMKKWNLSSRGFNIWLIKT